MRTSRLLAWGVLASSFAWLLAGGCSSADTNPAGPPGTGGSGATTDAQDDTTVVQPDAPGVGGDSGNNLNALCGVGTCIPDEQSSSVCRTYVPSTPTGGAGGEAGQTAHAGAAGAGGEGGMSSGGAPAAEGGADQGGASHGGAGQGGAGQGGVDQGSSGRGGEAGQAGGGAELPTATYGCQVAFDGTQLARQCELAGAGEKNAPCFSAADCRPSLACVTDGDAGRCLPYCCRGESACDTGSYCAERPLRKASGAASGAEPPRVPVCVAADDCNLDEPFPCPEGTDCRCKGDTACMVVRADRTTACLTPGAGQQGEACPCAWNHVCSSVTQKCVKLCRTDPAKDDCGKQKCQASSELPQNYGVCVGPT